MGSNPIVASVLNNKDDPVFVRFSRRTRGSSTCCSILLVPFFTALIVGVLSIGSLITILSLGPDRFYSHALKIDALPAETIFAFLLALIIVALFFSPKQIDKFVDWWHGL